MIRELHWDSQLFGLAAGKVEPYEAVPTRDQLTSFDHVHVRVPQGDLAVIWRYEDLGFRFVTVDLTLRKAAEAISESGPAPPSGVRFVRLRRAEPPFAIDGFAVAGSRLVLDPFLARRMTPAFWDDMLREHCRAFADLVIGAVDEAGRLLGAVSCLEQPDALDLFLVAVLGQQRGRGLGRALVREAERDALTCGRALTTSVVCQNTAAMNFYASLGFSPTEGFVVLHCRPRGGK